MLVNVDKDHQFVNMKKIRIYQISEIESTNQLIRSGTHPKFKLFSYLT